jgi:hypothetical protein
MVKLILCSIAAVICFGLAIAFLFFPYLGFVEHVLRHSHNGAYWNRSWIWGSGFISMGLAVLAYGTRDVWSE